MKSKYSYIVLLCFAIISCTVYRQRERDHLSPFFIYSFDKREGDSLYSISGGELSYFLNAYYRTPNTRNELTQFIIKEYGNSSFVKSQVRKIKGLTHISVDTCVITLLDKIYLLHDTPCEQMRSYYDDTRHSIIPIVSSSFLDYHGIALTERRDSLDARLFKLINKHIKRYDNRLLIMRENDTINYQPIFFFNGKEIVDYCSFVDCSRLLSYSCGHDGVRIAPLTKAQDIVCADYLLGLVEVCKHFIALNPDVSSFYFKTGMYY